MMLPIKPVCKKGFVRRDGTSVIFIQYCHSIDKRTLLNSGIAIPPDYWNRKRLRIDNGLPAIYGNADELNQQLQQAIRAAQDILNFAVKEKMADPLTFLKITFRPDFDQATLTQKAKEAAATSPVTNLGLSFQIDDYIKCKTGKVTPGMLKVYKNMKDHLEAFQAYRKKPITFECFDYNFYEQFVEFLTYEYIQRRKKEVIRGLKTATVGKTIKQLRIFLRDRMRRKIIAPIDLTEFKILDEEADAVYLTWEEIGKIYQTDLSGIPHLVKFRIYLYWDALRGCGFQISQPFVRKI